MFSSKYSVQTQYSIPAEILSMLKRERKDHFGCPPRTRAKIAIEKRLSLCAWACVTTRMQWRGVTWACTNTYMVLKKRTENLNTDKDWLKSITLQHHAYYAICGICTFFSQHRTVPYSSSPQFQLIIYKPTSMQPLQSPCSLYPSLPLYTIHALIPLVLGLYTGGAIYTQKVTSYILWGVPSQR